MKISIVIATYNRRRLLGEAIHSVLAQTLPAHEIIVVDDGGSDDLATYMPMRYPDVRYVRQENAGPAAARNNGIKHATGDWIYFLDSDDTLTETALACVAQVGSDHPKLDVIFGRARNVGPAGKSDYVHDHQLVAKLDRTPPGPIDAVELLFSANIIAMGAVLVRKSALEDCRGFEVFYKLAEDYDLWLRMMYRFRFGYTGAVLLNRTMHAGSLITQKIEMWEAVLSILRRYVSPSDEGQSHLGRRICALHYDLGSAYLKQMRWDKAHQHLAQVYGWHGKRRIVLELKRALAGVAA